MGIVASLVLAVSALTHVADSVYVVAPEGSRWIEAETAVIGSGTAVSDVGSFGGQHVRCGSDPSGPCVRFTWEDAGRSVLWVRFRGRGVALKAAGQADRWRWPKSETWQWIAFGPLDTPQDSASFSLMAQGDIDALILTDTQPWRPLEMPSETPTVKVDFTDKTAPVPPRLASANVNSPASMLLDREDWHDAVRSLAIPMMRFQVPTKTLDYRERHTWDEATFADLDQAVQAAREKWGVDELLFGVHRLRLPMDDGRLLEDQYAHYADGIVQLARRYAPPGQERVLYWEPFNELDHAGFLKKLEPHGQDFHDVAELYAVCSQALKAFNPRLRVGGPAAMWPGGWETTMMLETPGMVADFVSWHQYATGSARTPDDKVLAAVHAEKGILDGLRRMQKAVKEADIDTPLEYLLTEYHVNHTIWDPPDPRGATALGAVFAASVLINLGQHGVDATMIHDVRSRQYGLVGPASTDAWAGRLDHVADSVESDPIHIRPIGWVYRWFNEHVRGDWAVCEWLATPPEWADSARRPLVETAAAASSENGVVILINRDERPHELVLCGLRHVVPGTGPDDRPVRVQVIDDLGPRTMQARGPSRSGRWRYLLSPMSVSVATFPLKQQTR